MTDGKSGSKVPAQKWLAERLFTKAVDWAILGILGYVAVIAIEPLREKAEAVLRTPETMAELRDDIQGVSRKVDGLTVEVQRLKRPDAVFEMSLWNTGPIEGHCVESEPCQIRVRLRRLKDAIECRIVPNSVQWGFINPRADTFIGARRLDPPNGRNIGLNWTDIDITLLTPPELEPEADFTFEAFYTDCPGTLSDDDPISFNSPRDRFSIRSR